MLSREFLLDRGYCCGHGCLMCPYEPKHIKGNIMTKEQYDKLDARIANIEQTLKEFMDRWGPDVQEKRDKRDRVWDEMVRVVSLQDKHKGK
tara:strand:+ start:736 stop:1008 length:273 start_codon:yes stop_codon:yes gene_type:complete